MKVPSKGGPGHGGLVDRIQDFGLYSESHRKPLKGFYEGLKNIMTGNNLNIKQQKGML